MSIDMQKGYIMEFYDWPKVLRDIRFEYRSGETIKAKACADGLIGWFLYNRTQLRPACFGVGMGKIEKLLGFDPIVWKLSAWVRSKSSCFTEYEEVKLLERNGEPFWAFDYCLAAELIKELGGSCDVEAGLIGDWGCGDIVYSDNKPVQNVSIQSVSLWAIPAIEISLGATGLILPVGVQVGRDEKEKDWDGFWPAEALEVLNK
jgi:hypothetical protein